MLRVENPQTHRFSHGVHIGKIMKLVTRLKKLDNRVKSGDKQ